MGIDFAGWLDRVTEEANKRKAHVPTDEDLESWDDAATKRHENKATAQVDSLFEQMDNLLKELHFMYPVRARRVQREIRWLRAQAYKHKLPWGRKAWWQP